MTDTDPRRPSGVGPAVALVGSLVLVVALALAVRRPGAPVTTLDGRLVDAVNAWVWPRPGLVRAWRAVSTVGGPGPCRVLGVVLVVALAVTRRVRAAAVAALTVVLAAVAGPVVKALVDRPRPTPAHPVYTATGSSFPSGHALASMVLAVLVLTYLPLLIPRTPARAVGVIVLVAAVAVGLSRIALGVHNPTDVLGAWLIATALGCAGALATAALHRQCADSPPSTNSDEPVT